jgi:hypothetical protein
MSYSQAAQDTFVLYVNKFKQNGTYIDIGANHPSFNNNSFVLEQEFNWTGLLVEYDKSFEPMYVKDRSKSLYEIHDATTVNYKNILEINNFPKTIDYLSIDLDVNNRSTLSTLELFDNTVFDTYKFACITFEHDIYSGDYYDTRRISRKIFNDRGYELVFPDVCVLWEGAYKPFEDWYVHTDLVDMDYINTIKSEISLNCKEIETRLRNKIN